LQNKTRTIIQAFDLFLVQNNKIYIAKPNTYNRILSTKIDYLKIIILNLTNLVKLKEKHYNLLTDYSSSGYYVYDQVCGFPLKHTVDDVLIYQSNIYTRICIYVYTRFVLIMYNL